MSNLHSNKCEKPWDLNLDWCWFQNKNIEISLKDNFLTYLISCSVAPLKWWPFTGSYIHCQFHPHIHWKHFSSVVFLFDIGFTLLLLVVVVLLILMLLCITYNAKVCTLQNDMGDCNVSCAFPCANAPVSFSISWMICHSLLLSPPAWTIVSRNWTVMRTASLWIVSLEGPCVTYKIWCYLLIYNISVENWINKFNFRLVISTLLW